MRASVRAPPLDGKWIKCGGKPRRSSRRSRAKPQSSPFSSLAASTRRWDKLQWKVVSQEQPLNEARLPFTMNAAVSYGASPPKPLPDQLPPGWVRIPVSFQIMLPAEVMEGARRGGASSAGSGHGPGTSVSIVPHSLRLGAGTHSDDGRTWQDLDALLQDLQDEPLPPAAAQASRDDARPISVGALNSLGLHAAFGQQSGTRPVNPVSFGTFKVSSALTPPDAGNPSGASRYLEMTRPWARQAPCSMRRRCLQPLPSLLTRTWRAAAPRRILVRRSKRCMMTFGARRGTVQPGRVGDRPAP